ncbi:MAG: ABC transporter ATP-binding protein [Blastocatellia bacterium]|nr:ABC transporter ATP-binding protein [Blastocatellia bacterium]
MFGIQTIGLTKQFGSLTAVRNVNLTIQPGTIFGFLGPNGSGKSTTVKMLTGLLEPTAGDALINGQSILSHPLEIKRNIGVLPEDFALYDALTIWEHCLLSGSLYGLRPEETMRRAEQMLRFLDLWEGRHTFVDQASFGMKKKCSLALAVLHNPQVLFLDEPFEGIDPVSARNIKDLLQLMADKGATVFITSHLLDVVERFVRSFAIIVDGEVVCNQSVEEALESRRSLEELFFHYVQREKIEALEWIG